MLYGFGHIFFLVYFRIFYRVKVIGAENIPHEGAVILCSNHTSNNDPLVLGAFIKRPVRFLAKQELFGNRLTAFIMRGLNAIPVNRESAALASFKEGIAALEKGDVLGIFAQGRRLKELEAKDAKAGVALYALKSGAEVVPIRIESSYLPFARVSVNVGKPVDLSAFRDKKVRSEQLRAATDLIMDSISAL